MINGSPAEIAKIVNQKSYKNLYIDGGITIQRFLREDLIDEMIVTQIPIVLGGGSPLFGDLPTSIGFEHIKTEIVLSAIVQNHYRSNRLSGITSSYLLASEPMICFQI